MNYHNSRFLLNKRPKGMPEDDCWLLDSQEITDLKNNEILIQTELFNSVEMDLINLILIMTVFSWVEHEMLKI